MKVTVDASRLNRKIRAAAAATPMARKAALQQQAKAVATIALAIEGKNGVIYDTGRWRSALAGAANKAGAGPFLPAKIRDGRLNKVIIEKAVKQYRIAQARVNWYESQGALTPSRQREYAKAVRRRNSAKMFLDRTGNGKATIAIGLFGSGPALIKTTDKVYGGTAYFINSPTGTFLALHNREPHASLVEWRYKPMRIATSTVGKLTGLKTVKRAYVGRVLKASGFARGK